MRLKFIEITNIIRYSGSYDENHPAVIIRINFIRQG